MITKQIPIDVPASPVHTNDNSILYVCTSSFCSVNFPTLLTWGYSNSYGPQSGTSLTTPFFSSRPTSHWRKPLCQCHCSHGTLHLQYSSPSSWSWTLIFHPMTQNWVVQSLKNLGLKMPVQRRSNVPWAYQRPPHRPLLLRPYLSIVTSLPPQHRPIPVRQLSTFQEPLLQKNAPSLQKLSNFHTSREPSHPSEINCQPPPPSLDGCRRSRTGHVQKWHAGQTRLEDDRAPSQTRPRAMQTPLADLETKHAWTEFPHRTRSGSWRLTSPAVSKSASLRFCLSELSRLICDLCVLIHFLLHSRFSFQTGSTIFQQYPLWYANALAPVMTMLGSSHVGQPKPWSSTWSVTPRQMELYSSTSSDP